MSIVCLSLTERVRLIILGRREYHALSRGMILQEVFRRLEPDNKTLGQFLGENVFRKLGLGVHMGLRPEDQERLKIVNVEALSPQQVDTCNSSLESNIITMLQVQESALSAGREDVLKLLTKFINYNKETEGRRLDQKPPFTGIDELFSLEFWNSPEARRAELPSGGGLASARGLAVIAGHLARGGGDLLSRGAWQKMHQDPTPGLLLGGRNTEFTQVCVCGWVWHCGIK